MKEAICNIDITKDNGTSAHAIVRFPRKISGSVQLNMLLLQHDTMGAPFANAAEARWRTDAVAIYYEVNQ